MRITRSLPYIAAIAVLASASLARAGAATSPAALPNGGWDGAWSPDGQKIAFTSGPPHGIPNLWLMRADKSGLRQMTTRGAHEPHWLPDGKTIVFGTLRSGASAYMAIAADGEPGSETPVEALPAGAEEPVWSPDGALVAFGVVSKDGDARDLWFARTNGGGASGLTSQFWTREWAWSPDGSTLAFVVGRSTGTSLWTVDLATKDVRLLYRGYCAAPAYAPNGKQIAFAVPDVNSGHRIVLVDLATGHSRQIDVASFDGRKILWSPDGKRMYINSSYKSEPAVWTVGVNGKGLKRVTPAGSPSTAPALSPDGAKILCQVTKADAYGPELAVFSTAGKLRSALTHSSRASYWAPVWSPDGAQIAYQSDIHHGTELFTGPASGGAGTLCAPLDGSGSIDVSWMDPKTLLVSSGGRLMTVSASGGKDASKPLPKQTAMLQGPRLNGDEIIATEWGMRDAAITAVKLDGSGKRFLTQKDTAAAPPVPASPHGAPHGMPHGGPQGAPEAKPHPMPTIMAAPQTPISAPSPPETVQPDAPKPQTERHATAGRTRTSRANHAASVTLASNAGAAFTVTLASNHRQSGPVSLVADASGSAASGAVAAPGADAASDAGSEVGNPHAGLGLMGPQVNVEKAERPPVVDLSPAVSPDHKTVAFIRNDQVWLVGVDGTGERQITHLAADGDGARTLACPSWSPDGTTLLFLAFNNASGKMALELWTCRAEAGSERRIYSEAVDTEYGAYYLECTSGPAFTPDGQRVLFTSLATGEPRIVSIGRDGSGLRELVASPAIFPALDPAGKRLAYVDLSGSRERISVLDLATGQRRGPLFQ